MTYHVNYTLTHKYNGRIPVEADSIRQAELQVAVMLPELLRAYSSSSQADVSTKGDPIVDVLQLSIFEEDDGN